MSERGMTLLEILVSMGVLAFGLLALLNLSIVTIRTNAIGSDLPAALMLAEDFINQIKMWDINDGRLADTNMGNNNNIMNFDPSNPQAEHNEGELTSTNYLGIVPCSAQFRGILCSQEGTTPFFRRFWNVADIDVNGDGIRDTKMVAVHVVFTTASGMIGHTSLITSLSMQ